MGNLSLSEAIWSSVKPILKIYLIIITGFFLARKNILTVETSRNLSDLVVSVALPALTFGKIVTNLSYSDAKSIGVLAFVCVLALSFGGVFGLMLNYITPNPRIFYFGLICAAVFMNIGDLPIAFIQGIPSMIFDSKMVDKGVAYVCIFSFTQQVVFFNLGFADLIGFDFNYKKKTNEGKEENNGSSKTSLKGSESADGEQAGSPQNLHIPSQIEVHNNNNDSGASVDSEPLHEYQHEDQSNNNFRHRLHGSHNASSSIVQQMSSLNTIDTRQHHHQQQQPWKINAMVNEYSEANNEDGAESQYEMTRSQTRGSMLMDQLQVIRTRTNTSGSRHRGSADDLESQVSHNARSSIPGVSVTVNTKADTIQDLPSITEDNKEQEPIAAKSSKRKKMVNYGLLIIKNFKRPVSLAIVIGLFIALIPWLKALFVPYTNEQLNINYPNAPDGKPPLHFIIDIATYVGNSEVPLGLLLLGATLGRLEVSNISKGLLITSVSLAMVRLAILPIIGVALMTHIVHMGWFSDDMASFLSILAWGLPSMTTQIYITAFFTPVNGPHLQMDCMAIIMLMQYVFLIVSFPILVTYTLKNSLDY